MKPSNHDWIHRLIDEEGSPDVLKRDRERLQSDPEASAIHEQTSELGNLLRATYSKDVSPPHEDFFNHFLLRNIEKLEDEKTERSPQTVTSSKASESLISPLKSIWQNILRWTVPMAAGAALVLILNRAQDQSQPELDSQSSLVQSSYSPSPGVRVNTITLDQNAGVILTLEGLEEVKTLGNQRLSARSHVESAPQGKSPALHEAIEVPTSNVVSSKLLP